MNCKWCKKQLTDRQVYSYISKKSKGNSCSIRCSQLIKVYGDVENYNKIHESKCLVCDKLFQRKTFSGGMVCSVKCQGVLSSRRMKIKNPMFIKEYREKASAKQKEIKHKPYIQGGNGRGATIHQLKLYNELIKHNDSFEMELIEKTGDLRFQFNSPRHYKIDIASRILKLAIEVDGSSHNTLKIKECDNRKNQLLSLKGWKVLRFTNFQIQRELENCVQMVLSMI
jgi:very-short-patch-repair endonuclease